MGIIDDIYKQESEDIDNNFMKNLEDGKKKKAVIRKYLRNLHKSKRKYGKKYHRHLVVKKWKIWHTKKKKTKKSKYKHLEVKHFDFRLNFNERLKISLSIFFFNLKRFFLRIWLKITPKLILYAYYKITKMTISAYKNTRDSIENKKNNTKTNLAKFFIATWVRIKKAHAENVERIKEIKESIMFWKKLKKGGETEDSESGEGNENEEEGLGSDEGDEDESKEDGGADDKKEIV